MHLRRQEQMFQTVHLCLHLDQPVLPQPLSVPATMLSQVTSSGPPVNQHLSQLLRRLLSDQADVALQEMVVVENFYFIGNQRCIYMIPSVMINHINTEKK